VKATRAAASTADPEPEAIWGSRKRAGDATGGRSAIAISLRTIACSEIVL